MLLCASEPPTGFLAHKVFEQVISLNIPGPHRPQIYCSQIYLVGFVSSECLASAQDMKRRQNNSCPYSADTAVRSGVMESMETTPKDGMLSGSR